MAAILKKVLKSNSFMNYDSYNTTSSNTHGKHNSSSANQFECYNSSSKQHDSLRQRRGSLKKSLSYHQDSYNSAPVPHLNRSFSTVSSHTHALKQCVGSPETSQLHNMMPPVPPSPDISHLTPEELHILKRVFQREEKFEREEKERLREMEHRLETYEHAVKQQATGKGKLKNIDLRLCRLCFKTKFADGIGRVCHDCRKRVCGRCGTYSAPHWNPRKQKSVRGKWRCNICQLKREFVCQSGIWFYGSTPVSMIPHIRNKIQFHDEETPDTDNQTSLDSSSCFSASEVCTDPESQLSTRGLNLNNGPSKNMQNRNRRRRVPLLLRSSPSDNDSESDDSVERTRTNMKHKRNQRRNSSRRKSSKQRQVFTDEQDHENIYNGDMSRGYLVNGGNNSSHDHLHSMQRLNVKSDIDNRVRRHSDESVQSGSVSVYFKPIDSKSSETSPRRGSLSRVSNKDTACFAPIQTGLHHGSRNYDHISSKSPSHLTSSHRKSISGLSPFTSVTDLSEDEGRLNPLERRRHSHDPPRSGSHNYKQKRIKSNSIDTPSAGRSKSNQTYLMPPSGPANRCRRWSSDSGSSRRSSGNNETAESTDGNDDTRYQEYLASLKTREVLLYRDKNDQNVRCNGMGMRVVGGQCRFGGMLGAFVTYVDNDGPADSYGIVEGDQVLMWNGKSLLNATFEETKQIVNQSSEIVQLVVVHHEERAETADDTEQENIPSIAPPVPLPPSVLCLNKPKRRMLPKTPIEMKKEERKVSGRLQMSISYTEEDECLSVTLIQADDLREPGKLEVSVINPIALVHLLPGRGFYPPYETIPQFNTVSPRWNETFNILELSPTEVNDRSVEITVWNQQHAEDEFLGEVLLDLVDANTMDEIISYELQDHDENSSPLPRRKRKESYSDVTTTSPMTPTIDSSSNWSTSPSHVSNQNLHMEGRLSADDRSNNTYRPNRDKQVYTVHTSSFLRSLIGLSRSDSFSAKMKRKLAVAVSRMSSTFSPGDRRLSLQEEKMTNRSHSADGILASLGPPVVRSPRHSTDSPKVSQLLDITNTPRSHTCSETGTSIYDDNSDFEELNKCFGFNSPDRPAPDGDDITSMLGPAQVPPKPASEQSVSGDIRLGLMVSKGQLEIDIVCVTGLLQDSENAPPDTYVKTYLVEGPKVIQKKKTAMVKASYEPTFHRKIKYSACNIHGRSIKVKIWAKQRAFDKKVCLGETVIKLDCLDLSQHTLSWYKLFPQGATDFSSNESLSF